MIRSGTEEIRKSDTEVSEIRKYPIPESSIRKHPIHGNREKSGADDDLRRTVQKMSVRRSGRLIQNGADRVKNFIDAAGCCRFEIHRVDISGGIGVAEFFKRSE